MADEARRIGGRQGGAAARAFASPESALQGLDAGSVAALVAAASDVTLVMEADGTVVDMSVRDEELRAGLDGRVWIGRNLRELVATDSKPKVALLLEDAARAETKGRQLNHLAEDGRSVPVLYSCVRLGQAGRLMAFGRDMRAVSALQQRLMNAQASMEQEYSSLRDAETRGRLLFQTSSEAVLILDPARQRVVEANPAAREMLGADLRDIVGHALLPRFEDEDAVAAYLQAVRNGEQVEGIPARIAGREVLVRATAYRQDSTVMLLVRISSAHAVAVAQSLTDVRAKLLRAVEVAPDGFVLADNDALILTANGAFLEMAGLVSEESARGQPVDRWVGESGVDVSVLVANLRQRGSVRFFSTTMRNESGGQAQVEISAVTIPNGGPNGGKANFGLAIRNVGPRLRVAGPAVGETRASRALPQSVGQLQELIGRVALKELVREATEVIERLSIEAALELTNDNRASAAEMLGLSRQSLYVKLRRYGIGELDAGERE